MAFDQLIVTCKVFVANELEPLQACVMELNELVGEEVIAFNEYSLEKLTSSLI